MPPFWKTHNVVSIKHLLPYPGDDPFGRTPPRPGPVYVEGDDGDWKSYEIEALLDKRSIKRGRETSIEYLVQWKGWPHQYDEWYPQECLTEHANDLIQEYEAKHATAAGLPNQAAKRGRGRPRKGHHQKA